MSSHPSSSFPELRWVPVAQSLLLRLNLSSAGWLGRTRQGRETGGRRGRIRLYHGCTGRWGGITCHSLPGMPRMWTRVEAKETMVAGRHNSHCGGHMHSAGDHDPLYIKWYSNLEATKFRWRKLTLDMISVGGFSMLAC